MSEAEADLSLHMSYCHIVGNHIFRLLMFHGKIFFSGNLFSVEVDK